MGSHVQNADQACSAQIAPEKITTVSSRNATITMPQLIQSLAAFLMRRTMVTVMRAATATRTPAKMCCTRGYSIRFCSTAAMMVMMIRGTVTTPREATIPPSTLPRLYPTKVAELMAMTPGVH